MNLDKRRAVELKLKLEDPLRKVCKEDFRLVGSTYFGDEDAVQFYGLHAREFFAGGCGAVARMILESCPDPYAQQIAQRVGSLVTPGTTGDEHIVIDLFGGMGNLAYHIARKLDTSRVFLVEASDIVVGATRRNFRAIGFHATLVHATYEKGLAAIMHEICGAKSYIVIVDPPWGIDAVRPGPQLDLRATLPPVPEVLMQIRKQLRATAGSAEIFYLVKTPGDVVAESLLELGCEVVAMEAFRAEGLSGRYGLIVLRAT